MAGKPRIVWQALLLADGSQSIKPKEARTLSRNLRSMTWMNNTPERWQAVTVVLVGVKEVGSKKVLAEIGHCNYLESEAIAQQWLEWQKNRLLQQQAAVSVAEEV